MERNALITGGTRGIGWGVARCLAAEGYNLALNGIRKEEDVKDAVDALKKLKINVIYCRGDIGTRSGREQIVNTVKKNFRRLDVLVNNAGVAPRQRKNILEASEESFEEVIRINLQGPYFLTQEIANWMISEKEHDPGFKPCIITISSVSASLASVNRGEYCISKAGLEMMTKLFAVALGRYNIPVYEIRPGIVQTDMTAGVREKYEEMIREGLLLQRRWGNPEDVGKAVTLLAMGELPYSTGQIIMIDGGMTVGRL